MILKYDKEGRAYYELSPEEEQDMSKTEARLYCMENGRKAIVPPECKHEFKVSSGVPRNIKYCTECIYWEFTNEAPTE